MVLYQCVILMFTLLLTHLPLGNVAREEMMRSKLPNSVLRRIWALSDIDQDGMLDRDEFAVAMFLIDHKLSGNDLPDQLPDRLIPPSKKTFLRSQHFGGGRGGEFSGGGGPMSSYSQGHANSYREDSYRGGGGGGGSYRGADSYSGSGNGYAAGGNSFAGGGDGYGISGGDRYGGGGVGVGDRYGGGGVGGGDRYGVGDRYGGGEGYGRSRGLQMDDSGDDLPQLSSYIDSGH